MEKKYIGNAYLKNLGCGDYIGIEPFISVDKEKYFVFTISPGETVEVPQKDALDIARFIIESSGDKGMKLVQILLCNMSWEDIQRVCTVHAEDEG